MLGRLWMRAERLSSEHGKSVWTENRPHRQSDITRMYAGNGSRLNCIGSVAVQVSYFGIYIDLKIYVMQDVSPNYTVRHSYHYNFELKISLCFTNQNQFKMVSRDSLGCNLSNNDQISTISGPNLLLPSILSKGSEIAYAHVTFFDHSAIHF